MMTNIRIFIVITTAFSLLLGSSVYALTTSAGTMYSTSTVSVTTAPDYFKDSNVLYVGESIKFDFNFEITSLGSDIDEVNSAKARIEWSADVFDQTKCETLGAGMTIDTSGSVDIECEITLEPIMSQVLVNFSYGIYFVEVDNTAGTTTVTNESVYFRTIDLRPATFPHSPQNLLYEGGNQEVILSWEEPVSNGGSPITGYKVYRATGSQTPQSIIMKDPSDFTHQDTTVTNGVEYTYSIKAVNDKGESPSSNSVKVTPAGIPSAPENLQATAGNGNVILTWDTPNDGGSAITGYKIQVVSEGSTRVAFTPNSPFTDTGLTNGESYTYSIKAVNANGDGASSSPVSRTPTGNAFAPQNLQYIEGDGKVTLTWDAPSNNGGSAITGYRIIRNDGTSNTSILQTDLVNLEYIDNGLTNGQSYTYSIKAVNANGDSPFSNSVSAMPSGVPFAPTNLVANAGDGQVTLTWDAPNNGGSDITGYKIIRNDGTFDISFISTDLVNLVYTDTGLTNGESYTYSIKAVNANGDGASSSPVSRTPTGNAFAPQNLQYIEGDGKVTLTWDAPSNNGGSAITGYRIIRNDGTSNTSILQTDLVNLEYIDNGLTNGQSYTYSIKAVNANGDSPFSNSVSAMPSGVPFAPTNLVANAGDGQVTLNWTMPSDNGGSDITGYKIIRNDGTFDISFISTDLVNLVYTDTGLTNGESYTYSIKAVNANGDGASSSPVSRTPSGRPFAPQNLQAIEGDGNVTLNWDMPSDNGDLITKYNIYRGSGSDPIANTTGLNYTDTGLTNGEEYTYYIEAVNANGEGFDSYTVKATPSGVSSAPVNLQASSMNGQVALNWTMPSDNGGSSITGYMIFRNNVNLTSIIGFISVSTYNDSGVINGESYTYCIKAINSNGDSPCSSSVSVIPATNSSAPENLQATAGYGQLTLTWDAPSDNGGSSITGYMIFRNDVYLTTIGGLMYTNGGLVNGESYTYHIIAVNTAGDSEPSEPVSITIGAIPSAPENLQATSGDEQLTLSWSTPSSDGGSSIHGYKIYRNNVHIGTTSFLTFTDTGLTNGQSYLYCVSAINNNGDSPCSSPIDAIPSAPETSPTSSANFQFLPAVVILLFIISLRVLRNSKKRKNN